MFHPYVCLIQIWDTDHGTAWGLFKKLESSEGKKHTAFGIGPPNSDRISFDSGVVMNRVFREVSDNPGNPRNAFVVPILEVERVDLPPTFYSCAPAFPFALKPDPGVSEELLFLIDRNHAM